MATHWARPSGNCICIWPHGAKWKALKTGKILDNGPKAGDRFTVRKVEVTSGELYIAFAERGGFFPASAFRPLVKCTLEKDMAMFRHPADRHTRLHLTT